MKPCYETAGEARKAVAPLAGARIETGDYRLALLWIRSLPSRERELKRRSRRNLPARPVSLPSRERELKRPPIKSYLNLIALLPSRERELKLGESIFFVKIYSRSPRGSAN